MNQTIKSYLLTTTNQLNVPYNLGPAYFLSLRFLRSSEYWSRDKNHDYQMKRLGQLIEYAKCSPYYQKLFNKNNIKGVADFERIPLLDKQDIEAFRDDIVVRNWRRGLKNTVTTGGTTGRQLVFFNNVYSSYAQEWAFITNLWSQIEYRWRTTKRIVIRNDTLNGQLYKYDNRSRCLLINPFQLNFDQYGRVIELIRDSKIEFIHTYPSSAYQLARFLKNCKTTLPGIKAFLCSSENIYPGQKEYIEAAFPGARVFTWYGHSEQCILAGECADSSDYHIDPRYGFFELIDNKGQIIDKPGVRGEIVGTTFINNVMPLIRYRTGDSAEYVESKEPCGCGRHWQKIRSVEGRWSQELFFGNDGKVISMTAVNEHSDIFENVANYQFQQDTIGKVILSIVPGPGYGGSVQDSKILTRLKAKFSKGYVLELKKVKNIPLTKRGKYKYLIQNVKLHF